MALHLRHRETGELPLSLRWFLLVASGSTVLALLLSAIRAHIHHTIFGADGLWVDGAGFDFLIYYPRYLHRHSTVFFTYPTYEWFYPAPALLCYYPFYGIAQHMGNLLWAFWIFLGCIIGLALAVVITFAQKLRREGLSPGATALFCTTIGITSWPLYFVAQRGNIEGITWVMLAVALWAFVHKHRLASSVLIGLAGSVKVYPLIFGALFVFQSRLWKWLVVLAAAAAFATLLSLHLMTPRVRDAWHEVVAGVHHFTIIYGEVYHDPEWDHSFFGLIKDLTHTFVHSYHRLLSSYLILAGLLVTGVYVARVRGLPLVNQVLFLTCAAVTLPPTSFDYTLCLMYIPFAWVAVLIVRAHSRNLRTDQPALLAIMVAFGFVLAPTTFLFASSAPFLPGALKAMCLLGLMVLASTFPLDLWEPAIDRDPAYGMASGT